MIVTIFTTRIQSSKLFDGGNRVSTPDANTALNAFFRGSILMKSLDQMEEDPDRLKRIRDAIIESWLDKTNDSGNPYFVGETRRNLKISIGELYNELDKDVNDAAIKEKVTSLQKQLPSDPPAPFSLDKCFELGQLFKHFLEFKEKIITDHLLHLTDDYLQKAGINVDNNRSIFPVKDNDKSPAKGVYGIECLDSANCSEEWIKTLLECAKHLEGADDSREGKLTVQLILHDKDLPNDAFGQHDRDVYVLNDEELRSLVSDWSDWKMDDISQIKIAFFHHTTNALAHLVQNSYDGKNIHDKVSTFIDTYFSKKKEVELKDDTLYQ